MKPILLPVRYGKFPKVLYKDLNLICCKHNFAKSKLKNKTLISFCINLLIGILFSFPVFSGQTGVQSVIYTEQEYQILHGELTTFSTNSDNSNATSKLYSEDTQIKIHNPIVNKKNNLSGSNNDKSDFYITDPCYCNLYSYNSKLCCNNLYPTFVNISYLKDLRNTKMLC